MAWRCGNVSLGMARTGEIQAPPGEVYVLQGTRVEGNIQLGAGSVIAARIAGDLQWDDQRGPLLAVGNRDGVTLQDNRAGGNLQCKENLPPPSGSGNRAASLEDQCTAL